MPTWHLACLAAYTAVVVLLGVYGVHRHFLLRLYRRHLGDRVPAPERFGRLPAVTVQLPLYDEYHVVDRLPEAVGRLDHPRDRLQVQVLDDSDDATRGRARRGVEKLVAAGVDALYVRRGSRTGYNAGALAAGLTSASGEFILILDADFVPPSDILHRSIHHFTDPGLGMVQMRWSHLNREHSLLTRLQAIFLDGHFVAEGLLGSRGTFTRTPKQGIAGGGAGPFRPEYVSRVDGLALVELGMAVYFAAALQRAWSAGLYLGLPFLALFHYGFLYTALLSGLHDWRQRLHLSPTTPAPP